MKRYPSDLIEKVRRLRHGGKTYGEIRGQTGLPLPKSTLSYWCRGVTLPVGYYRWLRASNIKRLGKARALAVAVNRSKREAFFREINKNNFPVAGRVTDQAVAKIALAMLCLGEASKYERGGGFCLGSADPRIVSLFLSLLKKCFNFDKRKVRCTVQCRWDQNINTLEDYWSRVVKIPKGKFYPARRDPRTKGKPTKDLNYKGVLRVDYFDTRVQLELESLAGLIYNSACGPVVYR